MHSKFVEMNFHFIYIYKGIYINYSQQQESLPLSSLVSMIRGYNIMLTWKQTILRPIMKMIEQVVIQDNMKL